MSDLIPLILVPSLLCDERIWLNQINYLKNMADCSIPDTTGQNSIAAIAAEALRNAPPQFALAGISMGGYVALEMMRQAPERILKFGIVDSTARADTPEQTDHRRLLVAMSLSGGEFKGVTPRLLPSIIHPDRMNDTALTEVIMAMGKELGRDVFVRQQTAIMNRSDSRDLLKNIACPTLVICGRQDRVTPPEVMAEIADGITGARFHIIEECGHLSPLERPDEVNRLMAQWLTA